MNSRRTFLRCAVIGLVAVVPATAIAAEAHSGGVKAPKSGKWTSTDKKKATSELETTFKLKDNKISDLHGTVGPEAETYCHAGDTFSITTKNMKLIDAVGLDDEAQHYDEWAYGRNVESADPVIQPKLIKIKLNGKAMDARFWMVFDHNRTHGNGEITFAHQDCDLQFDVRLT